MLSRDFIRHILFFCSLSLSYSLPLFSSFSSPSLSIPFLSRFHWDSSCHRLFGTDSKFTSSPQSSFSLSSSVPAITSCPKQHKFNLLWVFSTLFFSLSPSAFFVVSLHIHFTADSSAHYSPLQVTRSHWSQYHLCQHLVPLPEIHKPLKTHLACFHSPSVSLVYLPTSFCRVLGTARAFVIRSHRQINSFQSSFSLLCGDLIVSIHDREPNSSIISSSASSRLLRSQRVCVYLSSLFRLGYFVSIHHD